MKKELHGNIVDLDTEKVFRGKIIIENGFISALEPIYDNSILDESDFQHYILPGFIDAHVHIESSMLVPSEFARLAVTHGTVATISDPHEIGNVLGVEGVEYMINNGNKTPFKFYFGAPSCVPATPFESAGAKIDSEAIRSLLSKDEVLYLAEMMNWPGVLSDDKQVFEKLKIAKEFKKPVDGHAPGLMGDKAAKYINAGISTDHECFTKDEALNKLKYGMKVIIREGSAAKNFDALIDLLHDHSDSIMFCSDDKHPDSLVEGHINLLVKRALERGIDLYKVLKAACINPIKHYNLKVGTLKVGDPADFIIVNNLKDFRIKQTYIDGQQVSENGITCIAPVKNEVINNFNIEKKQESDFGIKLKNNTINVILAENGQLVTKKEVFKLSDADRKNFQSLIKHDILKITVVNRYSDQPPAVAFVKNFGLKTGAIASSVAHDSHNIIAVGVNDKAITEAVNMIIEAKGGISVISNDGNKIVKLPVAGIMSPEDGYHVAESYKVIDQMAKDLGSTLDSPFMTLSFMALLVIPEIKLSDKGLFDGENFEFINLSN